MRTTVKLKRTWTTGPEKGKTDFVRWEFSTKSAADTRIVSFRAAGKTGTRRYIVTDVGIF